MLAKSLSSASLKITERAQQNLVKKAPLLEMPNPAKFPRILRKEEGDILV